MNPFVDTLHFTLRRSTWLVCLGRLAHGVALVVASLLAWRTLSALPLVLLVLTNAWQHLRSFPAAWLPADGCFRWSGDDQIHWIDQSGRPQKSDCLDAQLIGPLLIRLSLTAGRWPWQWRRLWIAYDALDRVTHRRLRARANVRGRGRRSAADR